MATITWQNASGSLGNFPAGSTLSLLFVATSSDPSSDIKYKLLSGNLPQGTNANPVSINLFGILSGVLNEVSQQEVYTFTVRAYDQYGNIRDRTFSLTVTVSIIPEFTLVSGRLLSTYDSIWVDYTIEYRNPFESNIVTITHTSGTFPPGLYINNGKIQGYAQPPTSGSGSPITQIYTFTLQLTSELGNDSVQYSIEVLNQRLVKPPHNRTPAICNSRPLTLISDDDPYYGFYTTDNIIPTITANDYFTFKIIGHDFEDDNLRYSFSSMPPGLTGDSVTGWITGVPVMNSAGLNNYTFNVSVSKASKPLVTTGTETFNLKVINQIKEDIVWVTPEDLGIVYNNTTCELAIKATSSKDLIYSFVSGTLPANLTIDETGIVSGRVAYQPADTLLNLGDETEFTFTVQAYVQQYPSVKSYRTFRLTVKQYFDEPVETVYFKISPSINGRQVLDSLLTDTTLIPTDYLYRSDDPYFGKSDVIKIVQAYGIKTSSLTSYINAMQTNHYNRNIVLGGLKTAIARDDNGDVLYEVVYSEIVDDLVNPEGVSVPESIVWKKPISLQLGPWTINNGQIFSSSGSTYTSYTPGSVQKFYPASLDNMRNIIIDNLTQDTDNLLLPKWMTSQQENGNTLGFIKCWVICYTKPGYSTTIKDNIENNWQYTLSDIDCSLDRYYVDRSTTYNWDIDLSIPAWVEVPSEITTSTNLEQHDMVVLFPRKTILPN